LVLLKAKTGRCKAEETVKQFIFMQTFTRVNFLRINIYLFTVFSFFIWVLAVRAILCKMFKSQFTCYIAHVCCELKRTLNSLHWIFTNLKPTIEGNFVLYISYLEAKNDAMTSIEIGF